MSKSNPERTKLSPVEAQFVDLVAQGIDMVEAWCQAYRINDKGKARQKLPSLLARPSVKAALDGLAISGVEVQGDSVDDADAEMLLICVKLAKSPTSSPKERLDAVRAYAQIRSKLAPQGVTQGNDPTPADGLGDLLDSFRQQRFTDADKASGFKPKNRLTPYGEQVLDSMAGRANARQTPGHPQIGDTPHHCPSHLESAQNFSQEESLK